MSKSIREIAEVFLLSHRVLIQTITETFSPFPSHLFVYDVCEAKEKEYYTIILISTGKVPEWERTNSRIPGT